MPATHPVDHYLGVAELSARQAREHIMTARILRDEAKRPQLVTRPDDNTATPAHMTLAADQQQQQAHTCIMNLLISAKELAATIGHHVQIVKVTNG